MEMKKLPELCNITTGKLDANAAVENGMYPYFTCGEIPSRIDEYAFDTDAILLAGNNAQGNFHVSRYNGKFNAYQRTYVLTAKENCNLDYIYYSLKLALIQLKNRSQGSQTKFLTMPILNDISINTSLNQLKIATVLSTLDNKIVLNHRINAKLEAMAKRLYDYWFVQFDFPNSEGKPYKSSGGKMVWNEVLKREIPEDWEVGKIGDFVEIGNGKDHSHLKDGNIPVYGSGGFMRSVTDYLFEGESVLFPRKGTLNNIMYKNERFWTVDTMFYSKMKLPHSAIYVYYTTKQFDFSSMNTGTGVPSMTSVIIRGLPIIQPFQQILDKFDNIVQGFYKQIHKNEKETAKLTNLRDHLLPLLMNGQVEVGTNNSSEFCNAKLGKQATACDMN